jgi:hypothetical protein
LEVTESLSLLMMMEMRGDGKEETEEESERPAIFSRSGREGELL